MARIRSIHPRIFTDERYAALSMAARVLLPGIWCEAWDDGVIEWRPVRLKMRIFPIDPVDVEALLVELVREKFITMFEADGKEYAAIRNFRKWQRPKKPSHSGVLPLELYDYVGMPKEDAVPAPVEDVKVPALFATASAPVDNQFGTGGVNPIQKGGREEGRKVLEGSLRSPSPRDDAPEGGGFEKFWDDYPASARSAPDYARRAYAKALGAGATPDGVLTALRRDVERLGKREMLSPTAWLQGGSWRIVAEPETQRSVVVRDTRFDGWDVPERMALKRWHDGARTLDAQHNALPEPQRKAAFWEAICENHPRVAAFIREIEAVGV